VYLPYGILSIPTPPVWYFNPSFGVHFSYPTSNTQAQPYIHAKGIKIAGAKIDGDLDLELATVSQSLSLEYCAIANINFMNADARELSFTRSIIHSLNANSLKVGGNLALNIKRANGTIDIMGIDVNGDLDCTGATFENKQGDVLSADDIKVKGNLFLTDIKNKGEVRLLFADIGGILDYTGAIFENAESEAFNADGIKIRGDLFFCDIKAKGEVRLLGADIGGDLDCTGASFENEKGDALSLVDTIISDGLLLNLKSLTGVLNIKHAQVGQLTDDESSWPENGKLHLDGFEYKAFAGSNTPLTAKKRLQWLRLQPNQPFHPQSYEQLAKVFRRMGHESDVREVLFAKQEDLRKYGVLSRKAKAWNWFLGFTIGHGYKPWKAFLLIALFWVGGFFMFDKANNMGIMQPSKERVYMMSKDSKGNMKLPLEYPKFAPCVYSVDVFVPFVDLHQENYWLPDTNKPYGKWFRIYFWAHIVAGWILSTLAAASLTGLIRKE
jgi:hypothetical protein